MATIRQADTRLLVETTHLKAAVCTQGYVSGVEAGSFVDLATNSHDPGFGLLIADFLLEPGADSPDTPLGQRYIIGDDYHGDIAKRYVALPQICTQAGSLPFEITRGDGFAAVRQWFEWSTACPPYHAGSRWEQYLLFPDDRRWFLAWDRFSPIDDVPCAMMRLDMPGHVKHHNLDTFRQIYLSYEGEIPAREFAQDFAPDARFLYRRDDGRLPPRFIRAAQLTNGVWLAGMALDPSAVYEAWCHQRDYVCFIEEIGGRPIKAGQWFGAVHLVGYFDGIEEMERTYDMHRGVTGLRISSEGWAPICRP